MRAEKNLLLNEVKEMIDDSNVMIITNYQNLKPEASWNFRNKLRQNDGDFEVVKKKVFAKAAEQSGVKLNIDDLSGHIAVVFAKGDGIGATKTIFEFKKSELEELNVVGGWFDGAELSNEQVLAISKLPSQDEMRAQFLGLLEAPMSQTVSVMQSLLTSILYCMEEKSQKEQ